MFYPLNHFSHHFLMSVFHSQNMSLWSLLSKYIHWLYPFNHCIHSIYIKQFNHFPIGRFQVFFLGNAFFAYLLSNYWNLWDCVRNQKFAYCKNSHEWTKLSYNESLLKHPFCFFVCPLSLGESVSDSSVYAMYPNSKVKLQILRKIQEFRKLTEGMLEVCSDFRHNNHLQIRIWHS